MEYKNYKARYNKTYYEKNKEKLRELQRQKRRKMKEALQKVEAEEQATETESQEPEGLSICLHISDTTKGMLFKAAVSGSLIASQAVYRAFKKTIEDRPSHTPVPSVPSSNPLD